MKTQETRGDAETRLAWKLRLMRMLLERRWSREAIEELLLFIDWIMGLPDALEDRFERDYTELERSQTMAETMPPLIRRAQARGTRELILRQGRKRFGEPSDAVIDQLAAVKNIEELDRLGERLLDVETWDELLQGA